jgi:phage terminase large subunit
MIKHGGKRPGAGRRPGSKNQRSAEIAQQAAGVRTFWDIGGAGAKADACAIWIAQWIKSRINVVDYIEGQGQVLGYYIEELRKRSYANSMAYLPHGGMNTNSVTGLRYKDHLQDAGFSVEVIRNQDGRRDHEDRSCAPFIS